LIDSYDVFADYQFVLAATSMT